MLGVFVYYIHKCESRMLSLRILSVNACSVKSLMVDERFFLLHLVVKLLPV